MPRDLWESPSKVHIDPSFSDDVCLRNRPQILPLALSKLK